MAKGRAFGGLGEIERAARREELASSKMVIEEEAKANQPGRALLGTVRQHEAHGPDDVRRSPQENLPLDQGFADEAELVIFEIAQPAVDEFAGTRRCSFGEIAFLDEQDRKSTTGGVARDSGAIDAAADDSEVEVSKIRHRGGSALEVGSRRTGAASIHCSCGNNAGSTR